MPVFAVVVLSLALIVVVALIVRQSINLRNPNPRSKPRARRGSAAVSPVGVDITEDTPRMPIGDMPPRPRRRRR